MADRSLALPQATFVLNTEFDAGGVSGDQVRRLAARGAIPAKLVGNQIRFDEERLPEIAEVIRRLLPTAAVSPVAAAPTARDARRLPRPAA